MEDFIKEWFNKPNWWFAKNSNIDNYIVNNYEYLLNIEHNITENNFIHYIILYDQLPRHIFRNQYATHIITYFLNKALDIVYLYNYRVEQLNETEWIFYMLPLRHTNEKENILYVLNESWKKEPLLKNFIIATYKNANFEEIITERISFFYNEKVLDYIPKNNMDKIKYKIGNFNLIEKYIDNIGIISLSGGVDSMVCFIYCIYMFPTIKWICVHINYKNRNVSDDEAQFIAYFCNKHNIQLYIREINEINRQQCMLNDMREIYEEYTKKIRFNTYKSVSNNPIVILGHNKDDAFENILTNITYNCKYNNLKGMQEYSKNDNIVFLRPLLNVTKNDIYNFAHEHYIPYVKNSTPEWSQRGKIRNNIVPVLIDWDKRVIDGLFNLSENIEELYKILDYSIDNFISKVQKVEDENFKMYKTILESNEISLNKSFYKSIFYNLCNCHPTNKSLISLIDRLKLWLNQNNEINKFTKIIINKYITVKISINKDYKFIFIILQKINL